MSKTKESKTAQWARVRANLKNQFAKLGITKCEGHWRGCLGGMFLGFAHLVRRNDLRRDAKHGSPEHIGTVLLLCSICHHRLDRLSKEKIKTVGMRVIERRLRRDDLRTTNGATG